MSTPTRETTLPGLTGFTGGNYYASAAGQFPGVAAGASFTAYVLFKMDETSLGQAFGNIAAASAAGWSITYENTNKVVARLGSLTPTEVELAADVGHWIFAILSYDEGDQELRLFVNGAYIAAAELGVPVPNAAGVASVGRNVNDPSAALFGSVVTFGYAAGVAMTHTEMTAMWAEAYRAGGVLPPTALADVSALFKSYRVPFDNAGTPTATWTPYQGTTPLLTRTGSAMTVVGSTLPFADSDSDSGGEISYSPAVPALWQPPPTAVGPALDQLATHVTTLIYRPAGVADGNVYTDFNELFDAFEATTGLVEIVIDDSTSAFLAIAVRTGGGAYDFDNRAWLRGPVDPSVVALPEFAATATITNMPYVGRGIKLSHAAAAAVPLIQLTAAIYFDYNSGVFSRGLCLDIDALAVDVYMLGEFAGLFISGGSGIALRTRNVATANIHAWGLGCNIGTGAITGAVGNVLNIEYAPGVTMAVPTLAAFLGTYNEPTALASVLLAVDKTITPAATVGNQAIQKIAGSVNFAIGAQTIVVTDDRYRGLSTLALATVRSIDATAKSASISGAVAGSFTITLNDVAAAETRVDFLLLN